MNAKTAIRTNVTVACLAVLLPLVAQTGTAAASAGTHDGTISVAQTADDGWPWDGTEPGTTAASSDATEPGEGWPWD